MVSQRLPDGSARRAATKAANRFFHNPVLMLLPLLTMVFIGGYRVYSEALQYEAVGVIAAEYSPDLVGRTRTPRADVRSRDAPYSREVADDVWSQVFTGEALLRIISRVGYDRLAAAGLYDAHLIRGAIDIQPRGDRLVEITVVSYDPELSRSLSNAVIDIYHERLRELSLADYDVAVAAIRMRLLDIIGEAAAVNANVIDHLASRPDDGETRIERDYDLTLLVTQRSEITERALAAQVELDTVMMRRAMVPAMIDAQVGVVDRPAFPTEPTYGVGTKVAVMAIFTSLGIVLSATFVALAGLIDERVTTPGEAVRASGLPLLAAVPTADRRNVTRSLTGARR